MSFSWEHSRYTSIPPPTRHGNTIYYESQLGRMVSTQGTHRILFGLVLCFYDWGAVQSFWLMDIFLECCSSLLMETSLGNRKVKLIMSGFVFSENMRKCFWFCLLSWWCLCLELSGSLRMQSTQIFSVRGPWITSGFEWLSTSCECHACFISAKRNKDERC